MKGPFLPGPSGCTQPARAEEGEACIVSPAPKSIEREN
jgi:hypothetical protein